MAEYSPANYTWGASFSYALLSRKERGDVRLSKLKIQDQKLSNALVEVQVDYKINAALNNYAQSIEQLSILRQLVENNEMLYEAEKSLFDMGESSVFMINSRESKLLKAQIEFIETQNKVLMLKSEFDYSLMFL